MRRLIYVAYFLEVGLLLVLVPWTAFWERNYFAVASPVFHDFVRNHFVRGAVSGMTTVHGTPSSRAPHARPCAMLPALAV